MKDSEYIVAYENILLGYTFKKTHKAITSYPRGCFTGETISDNEKKRHAIDILKYAFTTLLGWTPEICSKAINKEILQEMKLTNIIPFLQIPDEYNGIIDPMYFAHIMFPEKFSFDREKLDINIYKQILDQTVENDRKKSYPKRFFQNSEGYKRSLLCLNYALKNNARFSSIREIYELSCDLSKNFLKDNKLMLADSNFETPVDYFHEALDERQRNDFYFAFYKFRYLYQASEKKEPN